MKSIKFLLLAVLLSGTAFLTSCSKTIESLYPTVQELAAKDDLTEAELDKAVEVLCEFYDILTPQAVKVAEKEGSMSKVVDWTEEIDEKYPDIQKLYRKVVNADNLGDMQRGQLDAAKKAFIKAVEDAVDKAKKADKED